MHISRAAISRAAISTTIALALGVHGTATYAQLEEVIVTAQKRSESLQDVPIAITAFTGDSMKALGVTDATDLVDLTSGLQAKIQSGSNRNYFLRGIGTSDTHLTAASAVGQYFDGITLTSGFHARAALFDMERVEVLKGPQNTLFGLNTTGGAINYISNKPEVGGGTNGSVTLRVGNNSLVGVEAAVGFDIGSNAAGRISVFSNQEDGAFNSVTTGTDHGDDDTQSIRAQLLWLPSDEDSVLVSFRAMQGENNGNPIKAVGTRNPDGSGNTCASFNPNSVIDFDKRTDCISKGNLSGPGVNPHQNNWEDVSQGLGSEDLETIGIYVKFDHDFDWATFSSITSFDNLDVQAEQDTDGSSLNLLHFWQEDDRDTFQQEFRLVSAGDGDYRWIAGVYWLDDDAKSYTAVRSTGVQFGREVRLPNVQLAHTKENLGIYFQGEYEFTENLTLTAGVRWSREEIGADYLPSSPDVSPFGPNASFYTSDVDALVAAQNPGTPDYDENGFLIARQVRQELDNDDVGYTAKLDYKLTEDSLAYLSYSRGFKGSAADIRAVFALVPVDNILQGLEDSRLEPESLDAWELGYKGTFWDNRIQFDTAVFNYLYENLQQFTTPRGVPTLENAPESEINGFDANIKYAGDSGLYVQAGVTYLDTEVTDAEGSSFAEGAALAASAQWSYTALVSQDFEFSSGAALTLMANMNFTDEAATATYTSGTSQIPGTLTIDDYMLFNANATYRFGNEQQYAVSIFGNNLTDEHFCGGIEAPDGSLLLSSGGPAQATALHMNVTCRTSNASTRTYGVSFGYEF